MGTIAAQAEFSFSLTSLEAAPITHKQNITGSCTEASRNNCDKDEKSAHLWSSGSFNIRQINAVVVPKLHSPSLKDTFPVRKTHSLSLKLISARLQLQESTCRGILNCYLRN